MATFRFELTARSGRTRRAADVRKGSYTQVLKQKLVRDLSKAKLGQHDISLNTLTVRNGTVLEFERLMRGGKARNRGGAQQKTLEN